MSLKPRRMVFEDTWPRIRDTAECVVTNKNVSQETWSDRFWDIYDLCIAYPEPYNDRLYSEYGTFIRRHVMQQLDEISAENPENLLKSYHKRWKAFSTGMKYLDCLFSYLNQQHIRKTKKTDADFYYGNYTSDLPEQLEIGDLGLEEWKEHMVKPLKSSLSSLILQCVSLDREGKDHAFELTIVQEVIQSFVIVNNHNRRTPLDLYREIVEEPVVKASAIHYKKLAADWLQVTDVSGYAKRVLALIEEEKERVKKFFHSSSYVSLRKVLEEHMILDHLDIISSEIKPVIWKEQQTDMAHLYKMLQSIPKAMEHFAVEFTEHVRAEGVGKMQGLKIDTLHIHFVDTILQLYHKYKGLIEKSLKEDRVFIAALDRACSAVTNFKANDKAPSKAPELLSRYCDQLLKKSAKALTDAELEEKLNDCVVVFKYVDDKDIFQKFYSRMLAKRLIHQNSYSMDAEEGMINRLKQVCGYDFTNKFHRMFNDIRVSEDLDVKLHTEYLPSKKIELGLGFSAFVLQAGSWPLGQTPIPSLILPKEVDNTLKVFENFYSARYNGRKLVWVYNLCHADLKVSFTGKPYIVTMQAHQMAIMMLFENVDALTCGEIRTTLNIDKEYFELCLNTLLESKLVLLDTQKIEDSSTLLLNRDYTNRRMKVRVPSVSQKETQQEMTQTVAAAEEDRKIYLQACIVRIMKARKSIKHNDLIHEMMSVCHMFTPSINAIKKSIESLIEKNYIQRTPNAVDEYSYIA